MSHNIQIFTEISLDFQLDSINVLCNFLFTLNINWIIMFSQVLMKFLASFVYFWIFYVKFV